MLFKMFKPHYNRWEVGSFFEMIMNPLLEVHVPRYQWIYKIFFVAIQNQMQYEVAIENFLTCISFVVVIMLLSLLG
jgi:hypothetical protein